MNCYVKAVLKNPSSRVLSETFSFWISFTPSGGKFLIEKQYVVELEKRFSERGKNGAVFFNL